MRKNCSNCKNLSFNLDMDSLYCEVTNSPRIDIGDCCTDWEDRHKDTRVDGWREYNLNPKRKTRYKVLDRFNKYMWKTHGVWLWTSTAEAHDIVGGHIEWKDTEWHSRVKTSLEDTEVYKRKGEQYEKV